MCAALNVSNDWKEIYRNKTWIDILEERAKSTPNVEALIFENQRITYSEYLAKVNQLAKSLYAVGVRKGDHVGLWMTNRPEWCYLRHSIYKLGAIMVPINTRYKPNEVEYILKQGDIKTLITAENFLGRIDALGMVREVVPELPASEPGRITSTKLPVLKTIICVDAECDGCFSGDELLERGSKISDNDIDIAISADDIIHIMYSSGTTGFPKGILTPGSIQMAMIAVLVELLHLRQEDRFLLVLPFFGNMGLCSMSWCLFSGATLVATNSFRPEDTLRLIEQEEITHTLLVPTMLIDLMAHSELDKYNIGSLKHIASAGAVLPTVLIQQVRARTGISIMNHYGLAEAAGVVTWVPEGDTETHVERTVGLALPTAEVGILDTEGRPLPPGQVGEICTKETLPQSQHMRGYYKLPAISSETIRDGWLHTGDLGEIDEDGYVTITGRLKEMFIVGGFNVSPAEIEEYLLKHPKISNAAVVGVPDKRLGEVGSAFIILSRDEVASDEEIMNFCRENLADIKTPRYIFLVDELPLTPQGKVQKFKLREKAVRELSLEE